MAPCASSRCSCTSLGYGFALSCPLGFVHRLPLPGSDADAQNKDGCKTEPRYECYP